MDCKYLQTKDVTTWHGDVFDHPDYEYICEKCNKEVIPFIHCNKKRCENYAQKNDKSDIAIEE